MEKLFADYQISKMMKELGFNEECFGIYYKVEAITLSESQHGFTNTIIPKDWEITVTAPTWQQIKNWLWDKHKIHILVTDVLNEKFHCTVVIDKNNIPIWNEKKEKFMTREMYFKSPFEAEIEGIKFAVQNLHAKMPESDKNLFPPISEIK